MGCMFSKTRRTLVSPADMEDPEEPAPLTEEAGKPHHTSDTTLRNTARSIVPLTERQRDRISIIDMERTYADADLLSALSTERACSMSKFGEAMVRNIARLDTPLTHRQADIIDMACVLQEAGLEESPLSTDEARRLCDAIFEVMVPWDACWTQRQEAMAYAREDDDAFDDDFDGPSTELRNLSAPLRTGTPRDANLRNIDEPWTDGDPTRGDSQDSVQELAATKSTKIAAAISRGDSQDSVRELAATKIQAAYRGMQARKRVAVLLSERRQAEAEKLQRMSSRFHIVNLGEPRCEASFRFLHQRLRPCDMLRPCGHRDESICKLLLQLPLVFKGMIPAGFLSYIELFDDEPPLFLETRMSEESAWEPQPEYQVMWTEEKLRIGAEGWSSNLDMLWCDVLDHFDVRALSGERLLSESSLKSLNADPFILFGINNSATQAELQKIRNSIDSSNCTL